MGLEQHAKATCLPSPPAPAMGMQYLPRALGTIDFIFKKTPCPRPKTSSFPSERHISFLSPPSPSSPPPDSSSPRPRLESLSVPRSIRQPALHTPYPERGRHRHRSHHNHHIVSPSPTTGPLPFALPCLAPDYRPCGRPGDSDWDWELCIGLLLCFGFDAWDTASSSSRPLTSPRPQTIAAAANRTRALDQCRAICVDPPSPYI